MITAAIGFVFMAAHKWWPEKVPEALAWTAWAIAACLYAFGLLT